MWEMDAGTTDTSMAAKFGVTRQAIALRRTKEGWQKIGALATVTQRAQLAADVKTCAGQFPGADALSAAVDIRADLLGNHRAEWAEHRRLFRLADISESFEKGKSAKISAEMIRIRQDGERKAYGISDEVQQQDSGAAKAPSEMSLAELAEALQKGG